MLDNETKRRIDTARDILVGKVPDPKSQVEQITIALIYKFMDDMDAEAEELGGERTFFSGEHEKYGWSRLMAPNMGGYDVLNLYSEAIQKMDFNPNVPQLFRDIFKNAYLPYRDPETLKSFLKVINDFEYDHSERLGDSFEYLLSVLGSQGEAGQFRTPRHIIDFMVEIIDPKKTDTILDPACGTAGFLISSYKHILKHNSSNFNPENDMEAFTEKDTNISELTSGGSARYAGDRLTPDERSRLSQHIKGYDISPDMVRLSLVNVYLHGFNDPHIFEYDTLTSEDRWNEFADVILANPPFMSPKGGIKPHKRFSVQSKRSEVLFVDYMAEHLTPTGRAGVIVSEGIIFQSGTAYKQLRKILVENYLFGVVSLPAGVFNPYSGVKTSILLMDKVLAKKSNKIVFVKIENDGFDLGAQRRPITKNDLPQAVKYLKDYIQSVRNGEVFDAESIPNVLVVEKDRIGENGDWNLSGERYSEKNIRSSNFDLVEIGEVCEIISGQSPEGKYYNENGEGTPFYQGKTEFTDIYLGAPRVWTKQIIKEAKLNDILMSVRAPVGPVNIAAQRICIGRGLAAIRPNKEELDYKYLFYFLRENEDSIKGNDGSAFSSINRKDIQKIKIPLPPLEIQKEIVAEIESYQKIIDGARQVVKNYKPQIQIDPEWSMVSIENLAAKEKNSLKAGPFGSSLKKEYYVKSGFKIYGQEQVIKGDAEFGDYYIDEKKYKELEGCKVKAGDILISLVGTYGKILIVPENHKPGIINPRLLKITLDKNLIYPQFFVFAFQDNFIKQQLDKISYGGTMNILSLKVLKQLKIPLPPLETQNRIVTQIEKEQQLVNANKELIKIFEQKIKDKIASVWVE